MEKNTGSLTVTLSGGDSLKIGENITITMPEIQRHYSDGTTKKAKPTRITIQAPLDVKISRLVKDE